MTDEKLKNITETGKERLYRKIIGTGCHFHKTPKEMGNVSKTPQRCSLYVHLDSNEPYEYPLLFNCCDTRDAKAKENTYLSLNKCLKALPINLFKSV